jgi:hypothetical protein
MLFKVPLQKIRAFYKIVENFLQYGDLSEQSWIKIVFEGNTNSLKVHKNYFCNGTRLVM